MKDHPTIFNSGMVRAILDGRKTQTRRVIDFKKIAKKTGCTKGRLFYSTTFNSWAVDGNSNVSLCLVNCPYGVVGDRLWVRETWDFRPMGGALAKNRIAIVGYKADDATQSVNVPEDCNPKIHKKWRSPIHLPKWACRLFLEITAIRVERVREIGLNDCNAEGTSKTTHIDKWNARHHFAQLWNSINAKRGYGWDKNPWVWVIEFKRASNG